MLITQPRIERVHIKLSNATFKKKYARAEVGCVAQGNCKYKQEPAKSTTRRILFSGLHYTNIGSRQRTETERIPAYVAKVIACRAVGHGFEITSRRDQKMKEPELPDGIDVEAT